MGAEAKAAFATKGYFAHRKNKVGRQAGRVLASDYNEIVVDDVFVGTEQLAFAVPRLLEESSRILGLTERTKARTLIRLDAGGGTREDINGLIQAGYQILVKIYAWHTATAMRRQLPHCFNTVTRKVECITDYREP